MRLSAEVVICGAGIAGITAAYMLSVRHGISDILLVDDRPPMSLTSDKSTECYRNWWPGPGDAMVKMMNRSIELMDELARESKNVFHLNRRGYLYVTADPTGVANLEGFAKEASSLGAGEIRWHDQPGSPYRPAQPEGFESSPGGADILTDSALIQQHFPYLSAEVTGALHVRQAGWLSAQQYGAYMLDQAKAHGAQLVDDRVLGVDLEGGRVAGVRLASGAEIRTPVFINAAGPMLKEVGEMLGLDIPVYNELHQKASFNDLQGVVNREAPMVIFSDEQFLDWDDEEKQWLAEDEQTRWLTGKLPSGAHLRPEGGLGADSVLLLWDVHDEAVEAEFPPPLDPMYPELALRGLSKIVPGLKVYLEKLPKPFIDGGYYTKTQENRPLACPLPVEGAYVFGAMAGYGIMAAAALGELLAAHVAGMDLPESALEFSLGRYQDPDYQQLLANWGNSWQL